MNTIIINSSKFRNNKKEIESDYIKFTGDVTFKINQGSLEYKVRPITNIALNELNYHLKDNSNITIIGEITGIDNQGFIEIDAINIIGEN